MHFLAYGSLHLHFICGANSNHFHLYIQLFYTHGLLFISPSIVGHICIISLYSPHSHATFTSLCFYSPIAFPVWGPFSYFFILLLPPVFGTSPPAVDLILTSLPFPVLLSMAELLGEEEVSRRRESKREGARVRGDMQ